MHIDETTHVEVKCIAKCVTELSIEKSCSICSGETKMSLEVGKSTHTKEGNLSTLIWPPKTICVCFSVQNFLTSSTNF